MAVTDAEVREVLVAAKRLIADPKDWCGDGPVGPNGTVCSAHAINIAAGWHLSIGDTARSALARILGVYDRPDNSGSRIGIWNDAATTTHEMVMEAFDKAIESVTPPQAEKLDTATENLECESRRRFAARKVSEVLHV